MNDVLKITVIMAKEKKPKQRTSGIWVPSVYYWTVMLPPTYLYLKDIRRQKERSVTSKTFSFYQTSRPGKCFFINPNSEYPLHACPAVCPAFLWQLEYNTSFLSNWYKLPVWEIVFRVSGTVVYRMSGRWSVICCRSECLFKDKRESQNCIAFIKCFTPIKGAKMCSHIRLFTVCNKIIMRLHVQ